MLIKKLSFFFFFILSKCTFFISRLEIHNKMTSLRQKSQAEISGRISTSGRPQAGFRPQADLRKTSGRPQADLRQDFDLRQTSGRPQAGF
jgi:hypothetical protein